MAELKAGINPVTDVDFNKIDPDGLYIPRPPKDVEEEQQAKVKGTNDLYQAPFKPPFSAIDNSDQENVNPRNMDDKKVSKNAAAHRDHKKDGERKLSIIEDEYMNKAPKEDMLESYSEKQLQMLLEAEENEVDISGDMDTVVSPSEDVDSDVISTVVDEYSSDFDGLSSFDDLLKDEPEFDMGTDEDTLMDSETVEPAESEGPLEEARERRKIKTLREARGEIDQFFKENPNALKKEFRAAYIDHKNWADKKGILPAWPATFESTFLRRKIAGPMDKLETPKPVSKEAQAIVGDIENTQRSHVEDTYRNLIDISRRIASRDSMAPHHGFIYGTGGIGKSYSVMKTVEDICASNTKFAKWHLSKGSTSPAGLYQKLYKYRDGWVIIFDDNDGMLNDINALNYLKAAMDPDQPRFVSKSTAHTLEDAETPMGRYLREEYPFKEEVLTDEDDLLADEGEFEDEEDLLDTSNSEDKAEQEMLRRKNVRDMREEKSIYWIDHVDPSIDPATSDSAKSGVPAEFQFASRIIFISNRSSLPQPLQDRTEPGEINLTKLEILERIETIMDSLLDKEPRLLAMKDQGQSIKTEVLSYLKACVKAEEEGITSKKSGDAFVIYAPFTFRLFGRCVAYRVMYPKDWKNRVIRALREKSAGRMK